MEEQEDVTKDDGRKLTVGDAWDSDSEDGEKKWSQSFLRRNGRMRGARARGRRAGGL